MDIDLASGSADFVHVRLRTLVESQGVNEFGFRRGRHGLVAIAAVNGEAGLIERLPRIDDAVRRSERLSAQDHQVGPIQHSRTLARIVVVAQQVCRSAVL
jgi:hypothetical protein